MSNAGHMLVSDKWETRARIIFWILGILWAAILAYTTRHFINGDAINYIEMGEALRYGNWRDFVNLTASPAYAALLGLGQILLNTDHINEIPLLKAINFGCMIAAMWACDLLLKSVKRHYPAFVEDGVTPLPWVAIMVLAYSMFLFAALDWIRPRTIAPDMAVFACVLVTMAIILRIRETPDNYMTVALLGLSTGMAYLFKTFFFPFSAVFFVTAGLAVGSLKRAVPRIAIAAVVMICVCSPWLIALSSKLGRPSYGETGRLNYGIYIKGQGESAYQPVLLTEKPEILLYQDTPFANSTRPATFDPAYWKIGIEPVFEPGLLLKRLVEHLGQIFGDCPWLLVGVILWVAWSVGIGSLRIGRIKPLSVQLCLFLPAAAGILMYSLIHVEMRYVAPFIFLFFMCMVLSVGYRHPSIRSSAGKIAGPLILAALILGLTLNTMVDQTCRSLISSPEKPSYQQTFSHMLAVKDYLNHQGLEPGSQVAVVGLPASYWGRMARIKIVGEITKREEVLATTREEMENALEKLRSVGVRAVVAKGSDFAKLSAEGWKLVPGTVDFYVFTQQTQPPKARVVDDSTGSQVLPFALTEN